MASYHSTRQYFSIVKCHECKSPWLHITKGQMYRDIDEVKCKKHPGNWASIIERNLTSYDAELRLKNG